MYIVRDIFHTRYGVDDAADRFSELLKIIGQINSTMQPRLLLDFAGKFNTLVVETSHSSLADYESALEKLMQHSSFQQWYSAIKKDITSGSREILYLVKK